MGSQIFCDFRNLIICTTGQVDNRLHKAVMHQFISKLDSTFIIKNIIREIRKPVFYCALQVSGWLILRRQFFQFHSLLCCRHCKLRYISTCKKLMRTQTIFRDNCIFVKRFPKDFFCVIQNVAVVFLRTNRCGCTDTAQVSIIDAQASFQTTKQASQICALCAIECMQFIDCNIFKCLGVVILPQESIFRTHQQIVQHFIVGHQNIRCVVQHGFVVCNNAMFTHSTGGRMLLSTNIHPDSHISTEFITSIDQLRYTFRLIRCQGIHGVNNKCFYSSLATVLIAILQNWIEEALGFTGTSTRCN